jgi:CheY-like chemotaxis protein
MKKSKTILLVDDDEPFREILSDILSRYGFTVFNAENGCAALNVLNQNTDVNLLIIDWNMPILGGREFLKNISSLPALSKIPVIAISGGPITITSPQVIGVFRKPFELNAFISTIEMATSP